MIRLILIVVFVLLVLVIRFVPWWLTLGIGVTLILLGKFFAGRLFFWLFSLPFRAKGKVLRNASVEVHRIERTKAPRQFETQTLLEQGPGTTELSDEVSADQGLREYFEIDLTITPQPTTGPFFHWDIDDLSLVKPGSHWNHDDEAGEIISIDLVPRMVVSDDPQRVQRTLEQNEDDNEDDLEVLDQSEEPMPDEDSEVDAGGKVIGPHRLRMLIGVSEGVQELSFNYYFEQFGKLDLTVAR